MNRKYQTRLIPIALMVGMLAMFNPASAQFRRHEHLKVDVTGYPASVQSGYKLFTSKCTECHDLTSSLNQSRPGEYWAEVVTRMASMASSHINSREADLITKFLVYDQTNRKDHPEKPKTEKAGAFFDGPKVFASRGCSVCHSFGGQGNQQFPLDGIGTELTPTELRHKITTPGSKSAMPALGTDTTSAELETLVNFLSSSKK